METLQGKLILKEKSTETISGIERISQKWEPSESCEAQTAIEGIGTLDHLLPFYDPRPLCCDFWTVSYGLYRVYDKDGTVIYGERFPEKKMLADGREWQYVSADSVITMRIDGTTTVDGKVYHILRTSDVPDETTLLRENRGRVYRLDSDGETKMYDFSLSIGFFFRSKGVDADNENTKVSVVIKESGESANENMDGIVQKWEIYLHEYTIIQACERLGILYGGTLRDGPIAGSGIVLSKVKDADGTILYDKNMGVSAVKTEQTGDGRMYDLMGREIREPQRGTVYIQDGRKKVQR